MLFSCCVSTDPFSPDAYVSEVAQDADDEDIPRQHPSDNTSDNNDDRDGARNV